MFYITNTFGLIYLRITCNFTCIYDQIAVYNVNEKANVHIDLNFNKYLFGFIDF